MKLDYLFIAGCLNFLAATMHLAIIIGGPSWYRFFGAGEQMATMAEQGMMQATIITLCIAAVLFIWGAYAWSAAEIFPNLPFTKLILILITAIFILRAVLGFVAALSNKHPLFSQNSTAFWVWSSLICLGFGLIHLKGLMAKWYT